VGTTFGTDITTFNVSVSAGTSGIPPGSRLATAILEADYVFTVLGGTGEGLFFPCMHARGSASAAIGFDGIGLGIMDSRTGRAQSCPTHTQLSECVTFTKEFWLALELPARTPKTPAARLTAY
jgi:hypothetical protein